MNYKKFCLATVGWLISMSVASFGTDLLKEIDKAINIRELILQQDIHIWISDMWKGAEVKKQTWWKQAKYEDSIFKEISRCVVDYHMQRGVYGESASNKIKISDKTGELMPEVVVFGWKDPLRYNQENMNALVLYNLVYNYLEGQKARRTVDEVLEEVMKTLKQVYATKLHSNIETQNKYFDMIIKAKNDIKQYVEALHFMDYLCILKYCQDPIRASIWCDNEAIKGIIIHPTVYTLCKSGRVSGQEADVYLNIDFTNPTEGNKQENLKVNILGTPNSWYNRSYYTLPCRNCNNMTVSALFTNGTYCFRDDEWENRLIQELPERYILDFVYKPENLEVNEYLCKVYKDQIDEYNSHVKKRSAMEQPGI